MPWWPKWSMAASRRRSCGVAPEPFATGGSAGELVADAPVQALRLELDVALGQPAPDQGRDGAHRTGLLDAQRDGRAGVIGHDLVPADRRQARTRGLPGEAPAVHDLGPLPHCSGQLRLTDPGA